MHKRLILVIASVLTADGASAACCDLRKVEAEPATTRVRVCDAGAAGACETAWLFDGDVAFGTPQPICISGEALRYQEFDPATGMFAPPIDARCDEDTDVEL